MKLPSQLQFFFQGFHLCLTMRRLHLLPNHPTLRLLPHSLHVFLPSWRRQKLFRFPSPATNEVPSTPRASFSTWGTGWRTGGCLSPWAMAWTASRLRCLISSALCSRRTRLPLIRSSMWSKLGNEVENLPWCLSVSSKATSRSWAIQSLCSPEIHVKCMIWSFGYFRLAMMAK